MSAEFAGWPRVGGGAVILRDGAILLQRRLTPPEAGAWGIPGGKVDPFEPTVDAVRREVEEETGLVLGALELISVCDMIDRAAGYHWVAPAYLAMSFQGEPQLREPAKHSGLAWFDLAALPTPLTAPTVAALEALRRRR
ncbi:NUDIX domain-containing protein [Phenylobacterium sp.]|jgi:ADP-ribose pyrophosphatase YjhB (NUDIX family)|uniref:NUDIX domain-containing protein n=1 Tax=Phenylobacterium sp. TaxID=1871053 RepID=UPI002F424FFC